MKFRKILTPLCIGIFFFCLAGLHTYDNKYIIGSIRQTPSNFCFRAKSVFYALSGKNERLFQNQKELDYQISSTHPLLFKTVGNETVDIMGHLQVIAIAGGMNYHPRPIFQSYSSYTPYLQEINKAYFKRLDAPNYIIYHHRSIDGRYPTIDDSAALNFMLNNYVPVAAEQGLLLMLKKHSRDVVLQPVHEQTVRFGEQLDLTKWNKGLIFISVQMESTNLGRMITLLFQPLPVNINLHLDGMSASFAFPPVMGKLPFLINPHVRNIKDIVYLYEGTHEIALKGISFSNRYSKLPNQWKDSVTVTLYTLDSLN